MSHKAYVYLIKLLSSRDYSEHKLREKLREKKYPANEIETAIQEVKDNKYLREDVYAEARVKGFMSKGYSPNYIRQKLEQEHLKLDIETIESIFIEHRLTADDQIERLTRKKMGTKQDFDFESESKILRYLLSKGHDFSKSKKIMKEIINEFKAET